MLSLCTSVNIGGRRWRVDFQHPDLDLCTPVRPYADPNSAPSAFYLPKPHAEPVRVGDWVGDVSEGASVNVPVVHICVHGSCTHTECVGHLLSEKVTLDDLQPIPPFLPSIVLAVETQTLSSTDETYSSPKARPEDKVITSHEIRNAIDRALEQVNYRTTPAGQQQKRTNLLDERDAVFFKAVVIRVAGFGREEISAGHDFTGTNFPYLTQEAILLLTQQFGVNHLLINLPSVDREDDGGTLQNHRAIFRRPTDAKSMINIQKNRAENKKLPCRTVTELCNIPKDVIEGRALVSLQVSPISLDAAPSRPLVYYLQKDNQSEVMLLQEVRERYKAAGQSHVFKYFDTLDPIRQQIFLSQLRNINPKAVFSQYNMTRAVSKEEMSGGIENCRPTRLELSEKCDVDRWHATALKAIGAGEVGVILLAGGQGTRLGFSKPKGCFPGTDANILRSWIPSGKTLFCLQAQRIHKLQSLSREAGGSNPCIQWYIMTSPMTHEATLKDLRDNDFYGLNSDQVNLFQQGTLPCIADAGDKFILKSPSELATAPDGNGGIYKALHTYGGSGGMIADMERKGIKYLFTNAIDNCVCKIADPLFLGFCIERKVKAGNKVTEKREPHEKVGLQCIRNGCYEVVEYSDVDPKLVERRDETGKLAMSSGSVCIHYYTLDFLKNECHPENLATALNFHIAHKAIPVWDDEATCAVKPDAPNGVKLETFIFDVFKLAGPSFGVFEVQREEEFAPIKNASKPGVKDSPVTSALQMSSAQKAWLIAAGATVEDSGNEAHDVEISPLVSYGGENLRALVSGRTVRCPCLIVEKGFVPIPGSRAADKATTTTSLGDGSALLLEIRNALAVPE